MPTPTARIVSRVAVDHTSDEAANGDEKAKPRQPEAPYGQSPVCAAAHCCCVVDAGAGAVRPQSHLPTITSPQTEPDGVCKQLVIARSEWAEVPQWVTVPAVGGTLVETTRSQETEMRTGPTMLRKAAEPSAPQRL